MSIKKNWLVEKRNVLNEIRATNLSVQELRFLSIYLSRINARDPKSRFVRFSIDDFQKIMELGRININYLQDVTDSLLTKLVHLPAENGGWEAFQLFSSCKVAPDKNGNWYVEIDAHDKSLELFFEFKERYFSYQLWNVLKLPSKNQLRMYEILKQYEKVGEHIITLERLRDELGIEKYEYPIWQVFKRDVLNVCQQALADKTDITFTYEPYGKRGKGGKILSLKFTITQNTNFVSNIDFGEFIDNSNLFEPCDNDDENISRRHSNCFDFLSEACKKEFTSAQMNEIFQIICLLPLKNPNGIEIARYHYLADMYARLNVAAEEARNRKKPIRNRFKYFVTMLKKENG